MHEKLDLVDLKLLRALQEDAGRTNTELAERLGRSPSQVSRRRAALEAAGVVEGYVAVLNAEALGFGLRAVVRVNLRGHSSGGNDDFAAFLQTLPEVRSAHSVSGDADYVLNVRTRDLAAFADLVHERLLPHAQVAQIRSEVVLKTIKDEPGIDLGR